MKYSSKVASFLRLFVFPEKSMDAFIETFSKQSSIMGEGALNDQQKATLRKTFVSDAFLVPFAESCRNFFNEEEMSELVRIYELDVMQKVSRHGKEIIEPLYGAMQKEIREILRSSENDPK